jgi:sugar phosphate isomerase/epimerase
MAGARGLLATLEFLPGLSIGNLSTALEAVRHVAMPNFRLLLDAMHVFRTGASAAEIAALDPNMIGYVQLCDVPLISRFPDYSEEARHYRLAPGQGELPLLDFLAAIPTSCIVGLEVPMLAQAQAGIGPAERLAGSIQVTRDLLARAQERRTDSTQRA